MLLRYCLSDSEMVPVAPSIFLFCFYIPDELYFYRKVFIIIIIIIIIIIALCVMQLRPPAQHPIHFLASSSHWVSTLHTLLIICSL